MQDLLVNHIDAMRAYWRCRQLHRDTVDWIEGQRSAGAGAGAGAGNGGGE